MKYDILVRAEAATETSAPRGATTIELPTLVGRYVEMALEPSLDTVLMELYWEAMNLDERVAASYYIALHQGPKN